MAQQIVGNIIRYPDTNLAHASPRWLFTEDSRIEDDGSIYIGVKKKWSNMSSYNYSGWYIAYRYEDGTPGDDLVHVTRLTDDSTASYRGTAEKNHGAVIIYLRWCGTNHDKGSTEHCDDEGHIYGSYTLMSTPSLDSIWNYSPYNGDSGVSKYETQIDVGYSASGDAASSMNYMFEPLYSNWQNDGVVHSSPVTWKNLTPGTTYRAWIQLCNSAGNSASKYIDIRTLHSKPSISISHDHSTQAGLETLEISWSSDKNIQKVQYSIDGSDWIDYASGLNTRSGTVVISTKDGSDLYDNTEYRIQIRVQSTSSYDSRWSDDSDIITCRTDDRARLYDSSPRNLNIGDNLRIYKSNESGNSNEIRLYITDSDSLWKYQSSPSNDYNISFTQDEWDTAYRRFRSPANPSISTTEHNRIRLKIRVVTYGRNREYTADYTGYLIITGNMLTAYTNVGGQVKRGKAWCNPSGSSPKRAVTWISTGTGTWRRGI